MSRPERSAQRNPLALAVLVLLGERPMHPYEMGTTMRARHYQRSVRLNYGSLYSVVDSLERRGLVAVQGTERGGARPERTVFGLTASGARELDDWLQELVATPAHEYPRFAVGLTFLAHLDRDRAATLLRSRVDSLDAALERDRAELDRLRDQGIPRLVLLELEYARTLRAAELAWLRDLLDEIASGRLTWQVPEVEPEPAQSDHSPLRSSLEDRP